MKKILLVLILSLNIANAAKYTEVMCSRVGFPPDQTLGFCLSYLTDSPEKLFINIGNDYFDVKKHNAYDATKKHEEFIFDFRKQPTEIVVQVSRLVTDSKGFLKQDKKLPEDIEVRIEWGIRVTEEIVYVENGVEKKKILIKDIPKKAVFIMNYVWSAVCR